MSCNHIYDEIGLCLECDTPQPAGHRLQALRKREPRTCKECGESFVAIKTAKYCSNRCRQRAKRKRQTSISS